MRKVLFAIGVAGLFATLTPSAFGAVTIGQTFTPDVDWGGAGTIVQTTSPASLYVVPSVGVITGWSFEAPADVAPLKLKMLRPAGGDSFTTVGDSQLETPSPGILNTWPTRISVKAGDLLGEFYGDTIDPLRDNPSYTSDEISSEPGDPTVDPPSGTTTPFAPSTGNFQIDGSARLEADTDHDGFGDETQDQCPTDGATQGLCPKKCKHKKKHKSGAVIAKKCKKKHHH